MAAALDDVKVGLRVYPSETYWVGWLVCETAASKAEMMDVSWADARVCDSADSRADSADV